jgi:hypothetical protein
MCVGVKAEINQNYYKEKQTRVTRSVLCVCFVDRCLSFCPFSFGHCVVCPSSIYGFWLPLWYLQTLQAEINQNYYKEKQTSKEHDICLHQNLRLACIAVND